MTVKNVGCNTRPIDKFRPFQRDSGLIQKTTELNLFAMIVQRCISRKARLKNSQSERMHIILPTAPPTRNWLTRDRDKAAGDINNFAKFWQYYKRPNRACTIIALLVHPERHRRAARARATIYIGSVSVGSRPSLGTHVTRASSRILVPKVATRLDLAEKKCMGKVQVSASTGSSSRRTRSAGFRTSRCCCTYTLLLSRNVQCACFFSNWRMLKSACTVAADDADGDGECASWLVLGSFFFFCACVRFWCVNSFIVQQWPD